MVLLVISTSLRAEQAPALPHHDLGYYLPVESANYDTSIPTPAAFFGDALGDWHLHHHELVNYFHALAAKSDRLSIEEYAQSHGRRPLFVAKITSPQNQAKLEDLRKAHLQRLDQAFEQNDATQREQAGQSAPLVISMGYGVHGDEPSVYGAAVLLAYHLVAGQSDAIKETLDHTVVLLDPCLNPDGMERFAAWTNSLRGRHPSAHRLDREHTQDWPGGRSNYYWFDLNRDWMPLVHPESQGRVEFFQKWQPHVVTDYHEMGNTNRTYFFQPGIADMVNPLTPKRNQELTMGIAKFHAKALDALGSLYYHGESFDDFYPGKGSTYPDLNGSIGILFEQASSRGFQQQTEHGLLSFPLTIRNQIATSLSSLQGANALRSEIIEYQHEFASEAREAAASAGFQCYLFSADGDQARLAEFAKLLNFHQIEFGVLKDTVKIDDVQFAGGESLVIPISQRRYRMLSAFFEKRTKFSNPLFYDLSAWHLPSAFGLRSAQSDHLPETQGSSKILPAAGLIGSEQAYAYALPWNQLGAPRALWQLLEHDLLCWVATKPLSAAGSETTSFDEGTIIIPVANQSRSDANLNAPQLRAIIAQVANKCSVQIHSLPSGLSSSGPDLGSPSLRPITKPTTLLWVGSGASSVTAGDLWHQFDQFWDTSLTMMSSDRFSKKVLADFNTLLIPNASWRRLDDAKQKSLQEWVEAGGNLIAIGSIAARIVDQEWVGGKTRKPDFSKKSSKKDDTSNKVDPQAMPYIDYPQRAAAKRVPGLVVSAQFDPTHPLTYGYRNSGQTIAFMRRGTTSLVATKNPANSPVIFDQQPIIAGYIGEENLKAMRGSAAIQVFSVGVGRVVAIPDNPVFRGHWHGTSKLLANAIFFAPTITSSSLSGNEDVEDEEDEDADY